MAAPIAFVDPEAGRTGARLEDHPAARPLSVPSRPSGRLRVYLRPMTTTEHPTVAPAAVATTSRRRSPHVAAISIFMTRRRLLVAVHWAVGNPTATLDRQLVTDAQGVSARA